METAVQFQSARKGGKFLGDEDGDGGGSSSRQSEKPEAKQSAERRQPARAQRAAMGEELKRISQEVKYG